MAELNKETLKTEIEKLELDVHNLGKQILNKIESSKDLDEDSFISEEEKKKAKISHAQLKALKLEQKQKNDQLKIFRSIYTNLVRELKSGGNNANKNLYDLFKNAINAATNTTPVQSINIKDAE